jgi:hypothetical protein
MHGYACVSNEIKHIEAYLRSNEERLAHGNAECLCIVLVSSMIEHDNIVPCQLQYERRLVKKH